MKKAIQETLDLHHFAEAPGLSYSEYTKVKEIDCPLCLLYIDKFCSKCPWKIFEGRRCSYTEYNDYKASVARLTSWLEKCE